MTPEQRYRVLCQLAPFDARLTDDDHIVKGGRDLGVTVRVKGSRLSAAMPNGTELWSGSNVAVFCKRFWYWKAK